jgi:hypothetical protein
MRKSVITIACISLFFAACKNQGTQTSNSQQIQTSIAVPLTDTAFSNFISKDSANKMIQSYLSSINAPNNDSDLRSIIIDAKQLRKYIDSMPNSGSITNVKLTFAHTLKYINSGHSTRYAGYTSGKLTLLISAYNSATGAYVYYNTNEVIDFGIPCPSNCPAGNAGNPLLQ